MDILAPDGTILFQGTNEKGESLYDDASVREKNLMGINTLTLKFSTVDYIDFPEGSYAFFSRDNTGTGDITIHSLNPAYEDKVINIADVAQLFNIVEVHRGGRR